MAEAVLDVVGNTAPSVMLGNVKLSCKRQLSWFDFDEKKQKHLEKLATQMLKNDDRNNKLKEKYIDKRS